MSERLQKILASHGLGSRREIERWIVEGRIALNGVTAKLGDHFQFGDRVFVDGKEVTGRLQALVPLQVLMYHKPQGQALMRNDSRNMDEPPPEDWVQDHLPSLRGSRWIPLNPMHPGDSGLVLVTNDGSLDYALTRRKRWIPTAYMVRVLAPGSAEAPPEIPLQMSFDDGVVEFTKVEPAGGEGANFWYRVELERADRRAAVRALFESRDMKVSRMTQVMFGGIELPRNLPRMRHRELDAAQVTALYQLARIPQPVPPTPQEEESKSRSSRGQVTQGRAADSKSSSGKLSPGKAGQGKMIRGRTGRNKKLRGPAPDRRKPKRKY
jgi:23S rRNA pseudouridine2605 synthase